MAKTEMSNCVRRLRFEHGEQWSNENVEATEEGVVCAAA